MSNKIALVTGANKGIGKEIARGLAGKGMTVLVGARDETRGKEAVAELAEAGDVRLQQLDVTDADSIASAAQAIESEFGRLDVLVNNAGIFEGQTTDWGVSAIRDVYETNVFGVARLTTALLPVLRAAAAARIVNVSSMMGSLELMSQRLESMPVAPVYSSSKAAVNALTSQFATLLADTPIKVNAICPGYCGTDLNGHSGPRSPEQGATAAIQMATIGTDGPSGRFFNEDGPLPW